jgi:hypothetical protein
MSETNWIRVFSTGDLHRANIVQALLEEHGIESVIYNQLDSTNLTPGLIGIMVHISKAEEAMALIDSEIS